MLKRTFIVVDVRNHFLAISSIVVDAHRDTLDRKLSGKFLINRLLIILNGCKNIKVAYMIECNKQIAHRNNIILIV